MIWIIWNGQVSHSLLISLCLTSWLDSFSEHIANERLITMLNLLVRTKSHLDFGFTVLAFSKKNLLCQKCSSDSGWCCMCGESQWKMKRLLTVGWKPTMKVYLAQKQVVRARYECATTSGLLWGMAWHPTIVAREKASLFHSWWIQGIYSKPLLSFTAYWLTVPNFPSKVKFKS